MKRHAAPARDGGEGVVDYLAALLLIGALVGVVGVAGIGARVSGGIGYGVCKVLLAGGIVGQCEVPPELGGPPPGSPPPGTRPVNTCYGEIDNDYGELTVTFPVRYVDIRGGVRLGFQTRKIITPGKPDRWEVTVYAWGEGAVATPSLPGGQGDSDSPLGPSGGSPLTGGAWLGLAGTAGETYEFGSEKEARDFPWKYARKRAADIADTVLENNPATSVPIKIVKRIPWLGGKVEDALEGPALPPRKEWALEGGVTAGFSGKLDLFGKAGLSVGGRGWHMAGARRDDQGNTTFTLRDSAELEPSLVVDLGVAIPPSVRKRFNGRVDDAITYVEKTLADKYGGVFKLPPAARESLKANWPDVGLTWKGKIGVSYQLTVDENGELTKYQRIVDMQGNWFGRAADEVAKKDKSGRVVGNVQVPLGGERRIEHSTLDLTDPVNRAAASDFFLGAALTWTRSPVGAIVELTPEARKLDGLVERRGTKTRQTYDSNTGNTKFTGEGKGKRGGSLVELKLEGEDNDLSNAEIWTDGKGWVPWAGCSS